MIDRQCQSCLGTYASVGDDGVPYTHVCPPVACVKATRAGVTGYTPLAKLRPTDTIRVLRAGVEVDTLVSAIQATDQRVGDLAIDRPNKRDETVVGYTDPVKRTGPILKSVGDGVKPLAPVPPAPPTLLDPL